ASAAFRRAGGEPAAEGQPGWAAGRKARLAPSQTESRPKQLAPARVHYGLSACPGDTPFFDGFQFR
ncbi:hypothetical protein K2X30_05145, partial [bacterium]|nr:hypothetical protein [bacterium]